MKTIILPPPQSIPNDSLMDAIKKRRSIRKMIRKELELQDIANILWAGCGETRKQKGKTKNRRTIPSACNSQKVYLCIALPDGVYRYDEKEHVLIQISENDIRQDMVRQPMLKAAAATIIFIGRDELRTGVIKHNQDMSILLVGTEVGSMSQNIYLYCTARGLNTVLVALYNKKIIEDALNLNDNEVLVYVQVIG